MYEARMRKEREEREEREREEKGWMIPENQIKQVKSRKQNFRKYLRGGVQ